MSHQQSMSIADYRKAFGGSLDLTKIKYIVGIDCGTKTGFAVLDCTLVKIIQVECYTAHEAWAAVRNMKHLYGSESLLIRFEDARQRTWIPYKKNEKGERGRAQGAGSIKRDANLWQEFCEIEGLHYDAVAPKNNTTKLDAAQFKARTGWAKQTNEHSRDAAGLLLRWLG